MSDFDERVRRANQQFTHRTDIEQKEVTSRENARKEFLAESEFKFHELIAPILEEARGHIQPKIESNGWSDESENEKAPSISACVHWTKSKDRLALEICHSCTRSAIVFLADPTAAIVRVTSDTYRYGPGGMDINSYFKFKHGEGDNKTIVAEFPLSKIEKTLVEGWVADFIERILAE